jgi:HlyD family secretion protein
MVRPERQGLKVAEVLADAGDSVTTGQTLARLSIIEHGGERHRDAAALARD